MQNELFADLVASVREGGAILRGEAAPSRAVEGAKFSHFLKPTAPDRPPKSFRISSNRS